MLNIVIQFFKNNVGIIKSFADKIIGYLTQSSFTALNKTKEFVTEDLEYSRVKESRWKTWFPFSFFYGNGRFQPLYYFAWLFSHIGAGLICLKGYGVWLRVKAGTFQPEDISASDIAAVLGFVGTLITIYTINRNSQTKNKSVTPSTKKQKEE